MKERYLMAKSEAEKPDVPFTAEEAAEALRVHPKTLKRWLAEGKIKGHRLGRIWRIPRSEITRLLNGVPA
jgi:excisionase family DNA binding protein